MASFTSQRQVRLLGQALSGNKKKISGYSMIILHCIYTRIRDAEINDNGYLKTCALLIRNLVAAYYDDYNDDDVARFLLRCFPEVLAELEDRNLCKKISDFPDIPKTNVDDSAT